MRASARGCYAAVAAPGNAAFGCRLHGLSLSLPVPQVKGISAAQADPGRIIRGDGHGRKLLAGAHRTLRHNRSQDGGKEDAREADRHEPVAPRRGRVAGVNRAHKQQFAVNSRFLGFRQ